MYLYSLLVHILWVCIFVVDPVVHNRRYSGQAAAQSQKQIKQGKSVKSQSIRRGRLYVCLAHIVESKIGLLCARWRDW